MTEQDVHEITDTAESNESLSEMLAKAESKRSTWEPVKPTYSFKAGEVVVAESDTAYSFTDDTDYALFETLTTVRRRVMVARLRAIADMLDQ